MIRRNGGETMREWAEEEFRGAELSDVRRVERAITIAEAMAASPGASLPQMFGDRNDLKAAYRFLRHEEATPDQLQAGHRERVLLEMEREGRYLLLEDTTEILCVNEGEEIEGLGPVGGSKTKKIGFHLHSVMCVRWPEEHEHNGLERPPVELIGLADQQYYVRKPRPANERTTGSARRVHPSEELESALWEKASRRIGKPPANKEVRWIKVGDRGADIYDHIRECQQQKQSFVIRANQDRALDRGSGVGGRLFETVSRSAGVGQLELELRSRPKRPARTARLEVSITAIKLRSPQAIGHRPGTRSSIACAAVRVWEEKPPAGVEGLEWVLLTDLPVESFDSAREVAQIYATRWLEEEFHKALKTGMGVERLQLTTAHEWFAATALMSVAALRLISLRERVRQIPDAEAELSTLTELELDVLRARTGKSLTTVGEVGLAIGRLGGHLNRKNDGMPGWITLWRGWSVLTTLVEGVLLARKLTKFGQ